DPKNTLLRSIEVRNQLNDHGECKGNSKDRERSTRPNHARMIAHCSQRECSDCEKADPNCAGYAAPQTGLKPCRVKVDHLIERLDEQTNNNGIWVLLRDGFRLRPELILNVF